MSTRSASETSEIVDGFVRDARRRLRRRCRSELGLALCALLVAFACVRCEQNIMRGPQRQPNILPEICLSCFSDFLNSSPMEMTIGGHLDASAVRVAADLWLDRGMT